VGHGKERGNPVEGLAREVDLAEVRLDEARLGNPRSREFDLGSGEIHAGQVEALHEQPSRGDARAAAQVEDAGTAGQLLHEPLEIWPTRILLGLQLPAKVALAERIKAFPDDAPWITQPAERNDHGSRWSVQPIA